MIFSKGKAVFTISITAEMLDCHPRTLRVYDEEGFVCPQRRNNVRYYSQNDVDRLHKIMDIMDKWNLNIYGVNALIEAAKVMDITFDDLMDRMS